MAAAAVSKTYNVSVTINLKRSKEEIDFSRSETDKLYNLISTQVETAWAKDRIESIHKMIFMPSTEEIASQVKEKLKGTEVEEEV